MAKAISVRDLISQVSKHRSSESWVRLKFVTGNPCAKVAQHYQGRLQVKHAVQKRLFRKPHPDEYYCAALFQSAVKYRELLVFIRINDKHRIKLGEPGYPVCCGTGMSGHVSQTEFVFANHDFLIIPSVVLQVKNPGSWYEGKVMVDLKEAVF
jgi:hypothetical protein